MPVAKTVRVHVWPPSDENDSGRPLSPAMPFVITAICWVLFGLTAIGDSSSSPATAVALVGLPTTGMAAAGVAVTTMATPGATSAVAPGE